MVGMKIAVISVFNYSQILIDTGKV